MHVKLSRIIELHDGQEHLLALRHNLGDAVLCHSSTLYRGVRRAAAEAGYRFVPDCDLSVGIYSAIPMLALEQLHCSKQIPVRDNVTGLRQVLAHNQGLQLPIDFLLTSLKKNYLLHETAHCVARRALDPVVPHANARRATAPTLERALEEGFANAVELFVQSRSRSPQVGLFGCLNSYMTFDKASHELLSELSTLCDDERALFVLSVAFALTQVAPEAASPPAALEEAFLAWARRDSSTGVPTVGSALARLLCSAFELSVTFRAKTIPIYSSFVQLAAPHTVFNAVSFLNALSERGIDVRLRALCADVLSEREPTHEQVPQRLFEARSLECVGRSSIAAS